MFNARHALDKKRFNRTRNKKKEQKRRKTGGGGGGGGVRGGVPIRRKHMGVRGPTSRKCYSFFPKNTHF